MFIDNFSNAVELIDTCFLLEKHLKLMGKKEFKYKKEMWNLKLCKKVGVWSRTSYKKVRQYGDAYKQLPSYQKISVQTFEHKNY